MSEKAKDRLVAVGTRFTTLEHENQQHHHQPTTTAKAKEKTTVPTPPSKVPFWKKGTGASKVPGR